MGDALTVGTLLVVLAMTTTGAVAPSPDSAPSTQGSAQLKEIVHVRATTAFCRTLLVDAVSAVGVETDNDAKIDDAYAAMRTLDFDSNPLVKYKSTQALTTRFVALRAAAVSGIGTMRHFRDEAQAATDDAQRKSLTNFADVLSGALYRQKVLADDLGRFVAFLDAHEGIPKDRHDQMQFDAMIAQNYSTMSQTHLTTQSAYDNPLQAVPPQLSTIAKDGATDFRRRAQPIVDDERRASDLIDPAFAGC